MTERAPEVSVIIPTYNIEKYIGACLDSVLAQTFQDFECICVNDGSTDDTLAILRSYAARDSRIRIIDQVNQGGSAARNVALNVARGRYISFLDNDDLYHPQYLEILHHYAEKERADIAVCNYGVFFGDDAVEFKDYGTAFVRPKLVTSRPFYDYIVRKKKIHMLMWTKLYRRELLENIRFALTLPAINDVLFNLETLRSAKKLVTCRYTLIWHRILAESQTSRKVSEKKIYEYKDLVSAVNERILTADLSGREKKYLKLFNTKNAYYNFVYSLMTFNDLSEQDPIFGLILETLDELENRGYIQPRMLKIQDRLIYKAFKGKHLKTVRRLMKIRKILTH